MKLIEIETKWLVSYLRNFGRVGAEHPEWVVPEAAGEDEAAVHRHHEARVAHAHALAEVVAQVAPDLQNHE